MFAVVIINLARCPFQQVKFSVTRAILDSRCILEGEHYLLVSVAGLHQKLHAGLVVG